MTRCTSASIPRREEYYSGGLVNEPVLSLHRMFVYGYTRTCNPEFSMSALGQERTYSVLAINVCF